VTELRLALSQGAVRALVEGAVLEFDVEDEGIRVFLRCDDEALLSFKEQIERALLQMLPTGSVSH